MINKFKPIVLASLIFGSTILIGEDTYKNFAQLKEKETVDVDYKIESKTTDSPIAVIAIHGGKIEKGTSEVVRLLAASGNYNLYLFEGIKKESNSSLHITSTNFDEKIGRELVKKSKQTISVHGCQGTELETFIGGLDTEAGKVFEKHLIAAGFIVKSPKPELAAKNPENIVNDNLRKMGVQLELTSGLRESFLKGKNAKENLEKYVSTLQKALQELKY
jgi:phage replication-related protein YjqB (UPF0714/DUF867 family)